MNEKRRELYKAPESEAVGVRHEGLICTSVQTGNSITDWVDGGSIDDEFVF